MYRLFITNKNYSSWSLRIWVLMRTLGIDFNEEFVRFDDKTDAFSAFSPTSKVPCLVDGDLTIWESLAITEYLAEKHDGVWAEDVKARAWSRAAAAEMHAGFSALRNRHPMSVGMRIRPSSVAGALQSDIARIDALWQQGLAKHGGPFLGGAQFTAVDAFFCPVAFRFRTYGTALSAASERYKNHLLSLPAMREWEQAALLEPWRDAAHEAEAQEAGEWLEDLRAV